MAINRYDTSLWVVNINAAVINEWGVSDTPFQDDPIDQKAALVRGFGGGAITTRRDNPGRRVTLSLIPGSPNSAFLSGLFNSGATITMGATQVGTLEVITAGEGIIINDGTNSRAGSAPSDDIYIIEFNLWASLKGGS